MVIIHSKSTYDFIRITLHPNSLLTKINSCHRQTKHTLKFDPIKSWIHLITSMTSFGFPSCITPQRIFTTTHLPKTKMKSRKVKIHSPILHLQSPFVGKKNAYYAELSTTIGAIELAKQYNWDHLWLESNSILVVNAFKKHALVHWKLRNCWSNYLNIKQSMQFIVSHIYGEWNQCADTLPNC